MWCIYVGDEMGAVFSVLFVRRGAVGAPLWGSMSVSSCRCFLYKNIYCIIEKSAKILKAIYVQQK